MHQVPPETSQLQIRLFILDDTNTAIRFPAADTFTVETGGSERVRVTSAGNVNFLGSLVNVNATGVSSFVQLDVSTGGLDVDGQTDLDEVVVSGASTFTGAVKIDGALDIGTAGVDIDGQTDLDELQVAGVSTFSAKAVFNTAYPSIDADNEIQVGTAIQLGKAGVITATSFSGSGANLTGIAATDHVSTFDLVVAGISTLHGNVSFGSSALFGDNDKALFGAGDDLEIYHSGSASHITDSGTGDLIIQGANVRLAGPSGNMFYGTDGAEVSLYYDGSNKLYTRNTGVNVAGELESDSLNCGTGGLDVDGQTDLDELQVAGVSTFSAKAVFNTAYPSIDADNEIQVGTAIQLGKAGVVTATSFSGSGANLTGIGTQGPDGSFRGLVVAGISTLHDNVSFGSSALFGDNNKAMFGAGDDLQIYHDGSNNYVNATSGSLFIRGSDLVLEDASGNDYITCSDGGTGGTVTLKHLGNTRLETTADGADFSGTGGVKLPVGSTAQRPGSPAGDLRYNSDDGAFEGYTDSWGAIGGGTPEVDTNVSSTSAVGVGSFATASFRSAEVIAQIVQIDEYQVGKYLMIHDGTTVTVIEQAAVSTGDAMIGSFDGAINGSNAELRVTMVSSGIATVTTKISTVTV